MRVKPITQSSDSNWEKYRATKKVSAMGKLLSKKEPCTFREALEKADRERKELINVNDRRRK